MVRKEEMVIRKHRLSHFGALRVDPILLEATFTNGCSMRNCNAACCRDGVMADLAERDKILGHADTIARYMDPDQVRDTKLWFDHTIESDSDYPSGKAVGTRANERGCVFLKHDGRCVLQVTAEGERWPSQALKPFYCFAFPITIESGVLTVDDPEFTNRTECCSVIPGGSNTVLDVCRGELEFVLGKEGLQEFIDLLP